MAKISSGNIRPLSEWLPEQAECVPCRQPPGTAQRGACTAGVLYQHVLRGGRVCANYGGEYIAHTAGSLHGARLV